MVYLHLSFILSPSIVLGQSTCVALSANVPGHIISAIAQTLSPVFLWF